MKTLLPFLLLLFLSLQNAISAPNYMGQTVTNTNGTKGVVIRQYNTEVKVRIKCDRYEYWSYYQIKEFKWQTK